MDVTVVLFDDFELLDVFGPVELLSRLPDQYAITYAAPAPGLVSSSQGAQVFAEASLRGLAQDASIVASVCTGSALLAAAGLLEGYRATSNKMAFNWASSHGHDVTWVPVARWVEDRNRWTSSGVAAGIDMTAALIARHSGAEAAATAAREIEVDLHTDPAWDPFASFYGLA